MAATPQNGIMTFYLHSSKINRPVSVYVSDVAAAKLTFNSEGTAGTGSDNFVRFAEMATLVDFSMTTGTADTTSLNLTSDGNTIPGVLSYVAHVSTSPLRPKLAITFAPGRMISAKQNA